MSDPEPHVCFVGPMLGCHAGWVSNPAEELAPRLARRGFKVSLVSQKLNRYVRLLDIVFTIWRLRNKANMISLQVYGGPSFVVEDAASLVAQRLGLPIVMVIHGGDMPTFMRRFPTWSKRVLSRAQRIVTPSNYLKEAVKAFGFRAEVIPNAIEIKRYPFTLRRKAQPNLLWMRTFHEIYHPLMAVDVFAQVKKVYPQAQLTMAGQEKGLLEKTKQRVCELGLENAVRFPGFLHQEDKQREFAHHDVFLNTNRVDNMPLSLVEAAAFGIPIVATAVGGVPYLLKNEHTGLLVPSDDVNAMTQAVLRIMREPAMAENLSKNARCMAETYDWQYVLPQWEAVFREAMQ